MYTKVIKNKKKLMVSYVLISFLYSLVVGLGLYGWNVDYFAYMRAPNNIWRPSEFIGGSLSTLTISERHIGGYVVSFLLAYSVFLFNHAYFQSFPNKYTNKGIIFISLLVIHMWPVHVASTNALRQGVALAFILIIFSLSIKPKLENIYIVLSVFFLAIFSHKMGTLYAGMLIITLFISFKNRKVDKYRSLKFSVFVISFCSFFAMLILRHLDIISSDEYRSTGFDMSYLLFSFLLITVTLYFFKWNSFKNINLIPLRFTIILAFFTTAPFLGQSLVYERLVWPILILSLVDMLVLIRFVNFKHTLMLVLLFLSSLSITRFIFFGNIFV